MNVKSLIKQSCVSNVETFIEDFNIVFQTQDKRCYIIVPR